MTPPLALLAYALAAATAGAWMLRRSAWPSRSPRWGIAAWQALTASIISAVVLAGASLALPNIPLTTRLADLIDACSAALRAQYATPGGAAVSLSGAALAMVVLSRVGYCFSVSLVGPARCRRRQRQALALVARRDDRLGTLVVDHPTALAYCLPGRHREIVLTSAAMAALDAQQLWAVLAHERAHLRGRHDLILAVAAAAERAFPRVPAFRDARAEVALLVEMLADDVAGRGSDRLTMATALVQLADGTTPKAALGAGGKTALARVRRLLVPADPLGPLRSALAAVLTAAVLVTPVVIVSGPAVAAVVADYCPVSLGVPG